MPTGNNHRPTPRLSRLIAEQSNSLYGVTPEKAQGMVDEYRDKRDKLDRVLPYYSGDSPSVVRSMDDVNADASALNDFIKNRPGIYKP
jgi:hypothetical protein